MTMMIPDWVAFTWLWICMFLTGIFLGFVAMDILYRLIEERLKSLNRQHKIMKLWPEFMKWKQSKRRDNDHN